MSAKKKTVAGRRKSRSPAASGRAVPAIRATQAVGAGRRAARSRSVSQPAMRSALGPGTLSGQLARYGVLRALLAAASLLLIVFATRPGTVPVYDGWLFVPTVLLPVLSPLIFMLLLLDALMGRVLMSDMHGDERNRRRITVIVNLLLAIVLMLFWVPYYMALGK